MTPAEEDFPEIGVDAASADPSDAPSTTASPTRASQKVDLDLDDAPFLMDEEEAPPITAPAPEKEPEPATEDVQTRPKSSRKKLIIIGLAALLLILTGAAAMYMLNSPEPPQPEVPAEPAPEPAPEPEVVALPSEPPRENNPKTLEPFLVDLVDKSGRVRFLSLRLVVMATSKRSLSEIDAKMLVLRDAVYYYLKNKPVDFLSDPRNLETVKKDLATVMNQYLAEDQFDDVAIEEYLVR